MQNGQQTVEVHDGGRRWVDKILSYFVMVDDGEEENKKRASQKKKV